MKKSELKSLLKIIAEEVIAAKKAKLNESSKGLSGMKKAPESTEHTEKVADSKDLTGPAPKEKEEGKKLPIVKKPSNPQKVGDLKEEILAMIRESIEEMARTAGSVGAKFKVQDPNSPTGWSVKGHKTIPDGTPTEAPKGPYVPKGISGMGRPKKTDGAPSVEPTEAANSKIVVIFDGDNLGELDFNRVKGSLMGYVKSFLSGNNVFLDIYKIDPSVQAKLDQLSDMYSDGKLSVGTELNLIVDKDTVKAV
jgi:hypothetical protein